MNAQIAARIAELMNRPLTDSVIDDITDVYDDADAIDDYSTDYAVDLLNVIGAIRAGEFTIADIQN